MEQKLYFKCRKTNFKKVVEIDEIVEIAEINGNNEESTISE